ncbi:MULTISPECIES: NADH-quinone oxidoreductase subunit L [Kribbella]|uniref:NADH-quinone oxidoreductase subunit 5 family protein n=1 Tax=Kribbella TaxID=182639 RepID=UPI002F69BC92
MAVERPRTSVPFVHGAEFGLAVDGLAALVVPTIAVVTFLVLMFSAADIAESRPRFHGLMLLFAAAAMLTAIAATLPALLIAWEVMGATSYALIGFRWHDEGKVSAGLTAFVTTRAADLGLYVAAGAALAGGAGMRLADLPAASGGWRDVAALGILVAALGKAAQLPFSFWLSRAMEGPSPVSALLHSAAMVAMGAYLLLRVDPLLTATGWAGPLVAWVGAVTALVLGAVAVWQSDLKQLLAASTGAQLGLVVLAAGVGSVSGGTVHLIAHAFTKALLFLAAGAWLTALGTKRLDGLAGVARRWRMVGVAATVGALSLAGVAPLSMWVTKDEVLAAARHDSIALYVAGLAASALSAAYAGRVFVVIWRSRTAAADAFADEEETGIRHVERLQQVPLVILAIGAAGLGVLSLPLPAVTAAVGKGPGATIAELVVSAVIAVAVVLLMTRLRVPAPRWAVSWLGLEHAARYLVVRPTYRLADALARFDDRVVDQCVEKTATACRRTARALSRFDARRIDGAVEGLASGVRRLGRLARMPQTGQLHEYYVQAVAVLAVGVVLLLVVR